MAVADLIKLGQAIKAKIPADADKEDREICESAVDAVVCAPVKMSTVADSLERIARALEAAKNAPSEIEPLWDKKC